MCNIKQLKVTKPSLSLSGVTNKKFGGRLSITGYCHWKCNWQTVQILDEAFCISFHVIILGKGTNSFVLSGIGKIVGQTEFFVLEKNSELNPALFRLKIDRMSHPPCGGGIG